MNEIVTFGQGYSFDKMNNIIKSFEKNGYNENTKMVFLYKNMIIPSSVKDKKYIECIDVSGLDIKYGVDTSQSPYVLKVIYFYLYCKHISKANNVFLCDCTDLFINKDPFELVKDKVSVFTETEYIGKCQCNTTQVLIVYNQDILRIIHDKLIINGGLILGERTKCADLLKEMCADTADMIGRRGPYSNPDQAILNKVVYFDELNYHVSKDQSMVNCSHLSRQNHTVDYKDNKIIINGKIPHVVHQYPCFKNLNIVW